MDGGASIITFVTAGLQSIKIIHNACSTIKHWPETVEAVSTQLCRLEDVLQRIAGDNVPAALQDLIRQCTADLQRYAGQIQRLQAPDDASRGEKIWKRAKSVFDEGAVRRMAGALTNYGDQISLQLTLLQRDDLRESSRHVAAIATNQQNVTAGILSAQGSIASLVDTPEALKVTLTAHNAAHATALGSIEGVVREEATASRHSIQDAISSLHTGSSAQLEKITAMLHEVQDSLKDQKSASLKDEAMHAVIHRLCSMIDAKPRAMPSEEAEHVIGDIGALLDLAHRTQYEQSKEPHRCYSKTRGVEDGICTRDIRRVKGMLDSAHEIQIQQRVRTRRPPKGSTIKSNRMRKILELECGTLTINSTKRSRMNQNGDENDFNDFSFDIALMSRGHNRPAIFKTSVYQRVMTQGSFASIPNFVVHPIVPLGSPVFDAVIKGSVRDLEKLIWDGEASLRDHDKYGASLLHYAAQALNVDMCRYLVNTGAELDVLAMDYRYEPYADRYGRTSWTPLQFWTAVPLPNTEDKEAARCICKILLSAGADPGPFPDQAEWLGHFYAALDLANAEEIRLALDYGSPYVSINTTDSNGLLPIHLLAHSIVGSYNVEAFSLLLHRGASVHTRDPQGNTCLHHAMMNARGTTQELDALIFLVENGADVLATNYQGRSISDDAYDCAFEDFWAAADLWDALLARYNYDVNGFRKCHPRKANYGGGYAREHFNYLWKGFEARCPYYDPWWDTHTYYAPGDNESMYQELTNVWGKVYVVAKGPEGLEHTNSELAINEGVEMDLSKEADTSVDHYLSLASPVR